MGEPGVRAFTDSAATAAARGRVVCGGPAPCDGPHRAQVCAALSSLLTRLPGPALVPHPSWHTPPGLVPLHGLESWHWSQATRGVNEGTKKELFIVSRVYPSEGIPNSSQGLRCPHSVTLGWEIRGRVCTCRQQGPYVAGMDCVASGRGGSTEPRGPLRPLPDAHCLPHGQ